MLALVPGLAALALVGPRPAVPSWKVRGASVRACEPTDDVFPVAVRLSGTLPNEDEELGFWLGCYTPVTRTIRGSVAEKPQVLIRKVLDRIAYRHTELPSRWIVWSGRGWIGQLEDDLPWNYGNDGKSFFDQSLDYPTLSLPEDVAAPCDGSVPWRVADGQEWASAPDLKCASLTEKELAQAEAEARRGVRGREVGDLPYIEVCHCTSCSRQGADQVLQMFRHFGADSIPTCTRGACGTGPLVYVGKSDLTVGGLSYGSEQVRKTWRVRSADVAAEVLVAAGGAAPSDALVEAYSLLLNSFTTSFSRPKPEEALASAEAALATPAVWGGAPAAHSAALARRGRLRLDAGADWRLVERDARAAIELDGSAEGPRWLLAEILWRSGRRDESKKELDELQKMLFERRDEIERQRARLSGGLFRADYEKVVTSLPKRRREAIANEKKRLAFAAPLPALETAPVRERLVETVADEASVSVKVKQGLD